MPRVVHAATPSIKRPLAIFLILLGVALLMVYVAMLLPVAVNLPSSWLGLCYVGIGISGAISCFMYVNAPKRILLVPILAAVALTVVFLGGVIMFGEQVDHGLQQKKGKE